MERNFMGRARLRCQLLAKQRQVARLEGKLNPDVYKRRARQQTAKRTRRAFLWSIAGAFVGGAALAADTKISGFPAASALQSTDISPWVQGGTDVKATGAQVQALVGSLADPFEFDTRTALQAATVGGSVNHVRTYGYAAVGDGGGAVYKRVAAQPTHAIWIKSADGAFWEFADTILTPEHAGAVGDAQWSEGLAGTWQGTDNTTALQNAIDAVWYFRLADRLSFRKAHQGATGGLPTVYRTTATLQLGYGDQFITGRIEGPGRAIGSGFTPLILCDFSNGPGIAVNAGRDTLIQGISLWGRLWDWINQGGSANSGANLGAVGGAIVDDSVASAWVGSAAGGPTLSAVADNPYTQYCGIAVDPYAGPAPATNPYPNITRPSYAGGGTIYNNGAGSSNTLMRNVGFHGFVAGIGNQTGNFDSNGDFTRQDNCVFENCKIAIAVGNSQSRQVSAQGCSFANCWCIWDTKSYGTINGTGPGGQLGTPMIGCDASQCMNVFNLAGINAAGPTTFDNFYIEAGYRIGVAQTGGEAEFSILFQSCKFDMGGQVPASGRGVPATMLDGAATNCTITFIGGSLTNFWSVFSTGFSSPDIIFEGTEVQSQLATSRNTSYKCLAHNATAGGICLARWQNLQPRVPLNRLHFNLQNADTVSDTGAVTIGPRHPNPARPFCMSYLAEKMVEQTQYDADGVLVPKLYDFIDKSTITSSSLVNSSGLMVLTFTLGSAQTLFQNIFNGPANGDVLWDDVTGAVFFVRSVSGANGTGPTVITSVMQNNYKVSGGVASQRSTVLTGTGNFWVLNSRYYTPTNFTKGDFSSSSATITNVGDFQGNNGWVTTDIKSGDILYNDDRRSNLFTSTSGTITGTVNAGSFALAGNPTISQTGVRLGVFIRAAPANSSTN